MTEPFASFATSPFEQIKQIDRDGIEFWSARDLAKMLPYRTYSKFKAVLLKAQIACENSTNDPADHFFKAFWIVEIGSKAKRSLENMHLSRYACYLTIQNADPSKDVVAQGLTYFALQTYRQELADQAAPSEVSGYKGLYNGLAAEDIHRKKKLKKRQHILDHMGTTELAANLFRSTQAEDKLCRDNVQGKENANDAAKINSSQLQQN